MKNQIKLNEEQLRKVVAESVKRVLNEVYDFSSTKPQYDINSDEYKQKYDSGGYDDEYNAETNKEIGDYEALPDKARHPYGSEFPDFSNRIKNRTWKFYDIDKLAVKKPNSVYQMQQDKRRREAWIDDKYNMAKTNLPFLVYYLYDKGITAGICVF